MAEVEEQQFENYEDQPQENVEDMGEEVEADGLVYGTTAEMPEIKLFGRWSCDDVNVSDMSLAVSILSCLSLFLFLGTLIQRIESDLDFNFDKQMFISHFAGLHCRQRKIRPLFATFGWTLCC